MPNNRKIPRKVTSPPIDPQALMPYWFKYGELPARAAEKKFNPSMFKFNDQVSTQGGPLDITGVGLNAAYNFPINDRLSISPNASLVNVGGTMGGEKVFNTTKVEPSIKAKFKFQKGGKINNMAKKNKIPKYLEGGDVFNDDVLSGFATGAASGAIAGAPAGGIGAIPGAVIGGIAGGIGGFTKHKKAQDAIDLQTQTMQISGQNIAQNQLAQAHGFAHGGAVPRGQRNIFEQGGQVSRQLINVEKGEIAVREEGGIIKETQEFGGKPKHPNSGIDPDGNVLATEGDVVIPKNKVKTFREGGKIEKKSIIKQLIRDQKKREAQEALKHGGIVGTPHVYQGGGRISHERVLSPLEADYPNPFVAGPNVQNAGFANNFEGIGGGLANVQSFEQESDSFGFNNLSPSDLDNPREFSKFQNLKRDLRRPSLLRHQERNLNRQQNQRLDNTQSAPFFDIEAFNQAAQAPIQSPAAPQTASPNFNQRTFASSRTPEGFSVNPLLETGDRFGKQAIGQRRAEAGSTFRVSPERDNSPFVPQERQEFDRTDAMNALAFAPAIYNAGVGLFGDVPTVDPIQNREAQRVRELLAGRTVDFDQQIRDLELGESTAARGIRGVSRGNAGQFINSRIALANTMGRAKAGARLKADVAEAGFRGEEARGLDALGQQDVRAREIARQQQLAFEANQAQHLPAALGQASGIAQGINRDDILRRALEQGGFFTG